MKLLNPKHLSLTKALFESFERMANKQQVFVKMLPPFSEILSPAFPLYICSRSSNVSIEFSTS